MTGYCHKCKDPFRLWRWSYTCWSCGKHFCSDCLWRKAPNFEWLLFPEVPQLSEHSFNNLICGPCEETLQPLVEKYQEAIKASESVVTWSINYKGTIPYDKTEPPQEPLISKWFQNKDDALKQLKVSAAYKGFDLIYKLSFEKSTDSSGNYTYSIFKASGIPAHSLKKRSL